MKPSLVNEQNVATIFNTARHRSRLIIVAVFAAAVVPFNTLAQLESPVHYVSTNGNNTAPYDTWETAARSVQTAIDATEPGDTVQIGQGVFYGTFIARTDLTISGMGPDETIISGGYIDQTDIVISAPGFCRIWNLTITCASQYGGLGLQAPDGVDLRNCTIKGFPPGYLGNWGRGCAIGYATANTNTIIDDCRFQGNYLNSIRGGRVQNSVFDHCAHNTSEGIGLRPRDVQVSNCIFWGCGTGIHDPQSARVVNCLFYGNDTAINAVTCGAFLSNSTIVNNRIGYVNATCTSTIRNSILCNNREYGIFSRASSHYVTLSHNNVWNNGQNYRSCSPDAGSISLNPRFVSNTYYLSHIGAGQQYNSPCIDAGDSAIDENPLLVGFTTRTDSVPDTGVVDMGFHYPVPTGSLQVTIGPPGVVSAGAQWRRVGTTTWRNSGYTENRVVVGAQTVEFKTVAAWSTPANVPVAINDGQTTTVAASYSVAAPLVVLVPSWQWAGVGTHVAFKADLSGSPPLTYQWSHEGTILPGATNAELTLHNVQLTDAGTYSVRVTNAAGSADASATLTVSTVWLQVAGREADGRPRLSVHSPPGTVCELLASTSAATPLVGWPVIARLTNTTGTVSFTDPVANLPRRFYGLRALP